MSRVTNTESLHWLGNGSVISDFNNQLLAHNAYNLSFSLITSFRYTPPISTSVYNNERLMFTADNATRGDYMVSPQLSFPSLNLESKFLSYIYFEYEGGLSLALLYKTTLQPFSAP